jgi:1-acyl-sn-glycerol-3-phosphate acyltransferase
MPPTAIRRPLSVTAWLLMSLLCLVCSPLLLLVGALAAAVTGRSQPLLLAKLLIAYFSRELGVLLACGALWVASGAGIRIRTSRFRLLHYRLLRWFVHGLAERATTLLSVRVMAEASPETLSALRDARPLLLFSRHAGPGDTVLIVDLLLSRYGRFPSVVFKETLAIDPSIDLIGHRLPHVLLDPDERDECEARITEISGRLGDHGVLVLFPEGGNFSFERRRRALEKLWRKGRRSEAAEGGRMAHVLPPHPGGALAAMGGNPDADVVFAAHTGLGLASFPRDLWRQPPVGKTFKSRMWLAPAHERPTDPDHQVEWLYGWWKRIDDWIEEAGEEPRAPRATG